MINETYRRFVNLVTGDMKVVRKEGESEESDMVDGVGESVMVDGARESMDACIPSSDEMRDCALIS